MIVVKDKDGATPHLLKPFTIPMPTWFNHIFSSSFLNQDALFLHHQERHLANVGLYSSFDHEIYNYNKAVFPVGTDKGVINFRNWLQHYSGGKIPYKYDAPMSPASNELVFDVWNAHTKYCKYCQDALRRLKKLRFASFLAAICMGVVRPTKLGATGSLASTLGLAGVGLLAN